ncbi:hypothetical protein ACJX0J_010421 [Zea mays]
MPDLGQKWLIHDICGLVVITRSVVLGSPIFWIDDNSGDAHHTQAHINNAILITSINNNKNKLRTCIPIYNNSLRASSLLSPYTIEASNMWKGKKHLLLRMIRY